MTRLERLALTRPGRILTLTAGIALWVVAWPFFLPVVATALVCDAVDARKAKR